MKIIFLYSTGLVLITGIIFFSNCSKRAEIGNGSANTAEKVRLDAELSAMHLNEPDEFYLKNKEYNPSWFAKITVDSEQKSQLEEILVKKNLLKMRHSSSPESIVSWWKPEKDSVEYSYLTSKNAPVYVAISTNNEKNEVYIWWTCP